jgi:hypothetical protein
MGDVRNGGRVLFDEMFGTRYPVYENVVVAICGVDSSRPDTEQGRVGRVAHARISDAQPTDGRTRFLALHHPLLPIPGAGEALELPTDVGVDVVLSGHWRG